MAKKKKADKIKIYIIVFTVLAASLVPISIGLFGQKMEPAEEEGPFPLSVTDDFGNEVKIRKKPGLIASCGLFIDEILFSIVDEKRITALTVYSKDPVISNIADKVSGIPFFISNTLNSEYLISLAPDILFYANWNSTDTIKLLKDAGLTVFGIRFPSTLEEIKQKIMLLARVVDEREKGRDLVNWMETSLKDVRKKVGKIAEGRRLTVLDYDGVYSTASGRSSIFNDMLKTAGLSNAVGRFREDQWGMVPLSRETIIELDPDIILLPDWVFNDPEGPDRMYIDFVTDPAFSVLKAVKTNRVYRLPERHSASGSQYFVLGVRDLVQIAYPDE
ncbi:MAG: ABC transporter substrate-binding protein [Spirochaetales bacterium]|nr:ABC transporter substrate-binding protein [Spirochaetales bacterium]